MNQHKEQQGYLTIAANTADTDYLRLAYLQALNIKATQRINRCAVIVDSKTAKQILPCHKEVFDYIYKIASLNEKYADVVKIHNFTFFVEFFLSLFS
jgi:hypothetical protein